MKYCDKTVIKLSYHPLMLLLMCPSLSHVHHTSPLFTFGMNLIVSNELQTFYFKISGYLGLDLPQTSYVISF